MKQDKDEMVNHKQPSSLSHEIVNITQLPAYLIHLERNWLNFMVILEATVCGAAVFLYNYINYIILLLHWELYFVRPFIISEGRLNIRSAAWQINITALKMTIKLNKREDVVFHCISFSWVYVEQILALKIKPEQRKETLPLKHLY